MQPAIARASSPSLLLSLPPTRFAGIDRRLAAAIAIVTVAVMLALLAIGAHTTPPKGAADASSGDMAMYARIVERMHAGDGYYAAAHAELHGSGYGTRSVFNWRLPTLAWLESLLPSLTWASVLLALGALGAIAATAKLVRDTSGDAVAIAAVLVLAASLMGCATSAASLFTEIPAGVLILGSVAAYGLRRHAVGLGLALTALFIRELTAPYVAVCIYLAWRDGRRSELAAWFVGLAAFAGFFAWHYVMVRGELTAADIGYAQGWVQFGGLPFLLSAARFNGLFIALPLWVTAVFTPLFLLGLAAWPASRRAFATVAIYVATFAVIGKPFNDYWGALFMPTLTLGLAFVPAAVRDLVSAPRSPSPPPRAA